MPLLVLLLLGACAPPEEEPTVRRARPDRSGDTPGRDDTGDPDDVPPDDTDPDDTRPDDTDTTDPTAPLFGVDVSHWNGDIDWARVAADGFSFAYAKASEGTYYTDDAFPGEYTGAAAAGLVRGAYHFAIPDDSDGATQADFFVDNGGGWVADDRTLPGTLDIEYNPYGETCYGLSKSEMAAWIRGFNGQYRSRTGRYPVIYTTANWWDSCVGADTFAEENPMWVAHYDTDTPNLPVGWSSYTFWQYTSTGSVAGMDGGTDENVFDGNRGELVAFANGE